MTFSIGDVLDQLSDEFPDITVSKIRFLESQGLIAPMRTASGFRMFSESDITKLHWILLHQRDRFLPLKVIKEYLATLSDADFADGKMPAFDFESSGALPLEGNDNEIVIETEVQKPSHLVSVPRNETTATISQIRPQVDPEPQQEESRSSVSTLVQESPVTTSKIAERKTSHRIARNLAAVNSYDSALAELDVHSLVGSTESMSPKKSKSLKKISKNDKVLSLEAMTIETGVGGPLLKELVKFGVLEATGSGNAMVFAPDEVALAQTLAPLLDRGIEPRHIKTYALFASREVGFLEHVVQDDLRKRNPEAREIAQEKAKQFIQDTARLKEILLLRALKNETSSK